MAYLSKKRSQDQIQRSPLHTAQKSRFAPQELGLDPADEYPLEDLSKDEPKQEMRRQQARPWGFDFGSIPLFPANLTPPMRIQRQNHPPLQLQAKLMVGPVGDPTEEEADRVAAQVVKTINRPKGDQPVRRKGMDPAADKRTMQPQQPIKGEGTGVAEHLHRRPTTEIAGGGGGPVSDAFETTVLTETGKGEALDTGIQRSMGEAMGMDLRSVKIHDNRTADDLNQSIQAKAFTIGNHVFFRQGAYDPRSIKGQELIVHELTHVAQKNKSLITKQPENHQAEQKNNGAPVVTGNNTYQQQHFNNSPEYVIQRAEILVGDKRYRKSDIAQYREVTTAVNEGMLAKMFTGDDKKLWKFRSEVTFLKTIEALHKAKWNGDTADLPHQLKVRRKDPGPGEERGTVVIKGQGAYGNESALRRKMKREYMPGLKMVLLDPRVEKMAADPISKWAFKNWPEMNRAIDEWYDITEYPAGLMKYRVAITPSKSDDWKPEKVTVANAKKWKNRFDTIWEVCGQTAEYLIARIHALEGQVELAYAKVLKGQAGAEELKHIMTRRVHETTLMNIGNDVLHEFTIEKRPWDQQAVLHQGYLAAYNALWWAGLEEGLLGDRLPDREKKALKEARNDYGKGQPINLEEMAEKLKQFMIAGRMNTDEAKKAWAELPFHPAKPLWSAAEPDLRVKIWKVKHPEKVRETLKGGEQTWLTTAVLKEAQTVYKKILEATGRKGPEERQEEKERAEMRNDAQRALGGPLFESAEDPPIYNPRHDADVFWEALWELAREEGKVHPKKRR